MFYDLPEKTGKLARRVALGATLTLAALAGCSSTRLDSVYLKGNRVDEISSTDSRYNLEGITLAGKPHLVKPAVDRLENEADFILVPYEGNVILDLNKRRVSLEETVYKVPVIWDYGNDNLPETDLVFDVKKGQYPVKAEIRTPSSNNDDGIWELTQDNIRFKLRTKIIRNREYVVGGDYSSENLNDPLILLAEKEGSIPIINLESGQITIRSPKIYAIHKTTATEYVNQRKEFEEKKFEREMEAGKLEQERLNREALMETIPAIILPKADTQQDPNKPEAIPLVPVPSSIEKSDEKRQFSRFLPNWVFM